MHFQAQNPTASDFPLPSVPSKTAVQSMSPGTNHNCKFIQFSFSPESSFFHISTRWPPMHHSSTEATEQYSVPQHSSQAAIKCPTGQNLGSHSKACLICHTEILYSFPNTTSCDWCKVSTQIKLPAVFTSTFAFFLSDWNHSISPLEKMSLFTFFLNLSIFHSWTVFALMAVVV